MAGADSSTHERILTRPLFAFLILLAAIGSHAAWDRFRAPAAAVTIRELADGDLDGAERARALRALVAAGAASARLEIQWAGLIAAVGLSDRVAYAAAWKQVGGSVSDLTGLRPPAAADRPDLGLGDAVLVGVAQATWLEAASQRDQARVRWRQVEAQCRIVPRPLAAELAAAAIERLR